MTKGRNGVGVQGSRSTNKKGEARGSDSLLKDAGELALTSFFLEVHPGSNLTCTVKLGRYLRRSK
jgi:hypothetical protein